MPWSLWKLVKFRSPYTAFKGPDITADVVLFTFGQQFQSLKYPSYLLPHVSCCFIAACISLPPSLVPSLYGTVLLHLPMLLHAASKFIFCIQWTALLQNRSSPYGPPVFKIYRSVQYFTGPLWTIIQDHQMFGMEIIIFQDIYWHSNQNLFKILVDCTDYQL